MMLLDNGTFGSVIPWLCSVCYHAMCLSIDVHVMSVLKCISYHIDLYSIHGVQRHNDTL